MIYDVSFIADFFPAERIDAHDELLSMMRQFPRELYVKKQIYTVRYKGVHMPLFFAVKLHLLLASSASSRSTKYYHRYRAGLLSMGRKLTPLEREAFMKFLPVEAYSRHVRQSPYGRSKRVICVTTGEEYETMKSAAESTGVHVNSVRWCCQLPGASVKGLQFKHPEEPRSNRAALEALS